MPGKLWTKDEIQFIEDNYKTMTCKEMGKEINRSTRSVQHMYNNLGLFNELPEIGDKFNRLEILELFFINIGSQNKTYVKCRCNCGNIQEKVRLTDVVAGNIKSCGCLLSEKASERCIKRNTSHGLSYHPLFQTWNSMKRRCYNTKQKQYKNYGGRGIKICDEWRYNFRCFYDWALENKWENGLTIERINNNGNYEPGNCKWIPKSEQSRNTRNNVFITAFGETKIIKDWEKDSRCKVNSHAITYRINEGWNPETAIMTPILINRYAGEPKILEENVSYAI